ncbi:MAG: hypothetical protein FJ147_24755 [Deltaproteobacteria bacterium]|nr:hypothetical protein [Deltaproteobacteria bacterium]
MLFAREQHLVHRPLQEILTCIDAVIARLLDPHSEERREAETTLPPETGLSPAMVRHTLPLVFQEYRAERLTTLLQEEFGDLTALDSFVTINGKRRRAYGPTLTSHVLAGNLPGAGLDSVIFSLLVKSATLLKTSSHNSSLPLLFARTLTQVDPELGACLTVVTWPGGSLPLEETAFGRADVVIASGSDRSLAAIRSQVKGKFIGYGHKISFAAITKEALNDAQTLAQKAAYDVALFDQQGCLSPQLIYVEEGGAVSPQMFASLVAEALTAWEQTLPRGQAPQDVSVAIRRARDEAEWQAVAGKDVALYTSSQGTAWTVIYEADPTFTPSPLYRTIRIKPLSSLTQLHELLMPWQPYLEAVGIAAPATRNLALADILGQAGVSRICPIGTMQTPPLSWRHGGRSRITDLLRWVEVEL